jgi:hypothetical protein
VPAIGADLAAVLETYQKLRAAKTPHEALVDLLTAAEGETVAARATLEREFAVLGLAALGDVNRVAEVLEDARHPEAREAAILALRHWIGEGPERDPQLQALLRATLTLTEAQADTILQLLHSPFSPEQPETFTVLLAYLKHDRLAVRELARWQLERLLPRGRIAPFNAAAPAVERDKAIQAWKELIEKPK